MDGLVFGVRAGRYIFGMKKHPFLFTLLLIVLLAGGLYSLANAVDAFAPSITLTIPKSESLSQTSGYSSSPSWILAGTLSLLQTSSYSSTPAWKFAGSFSLAHTSAYS